MAAPSNARKRDTANRSAAAAPDAGHKWSDLFKSTSKLSSSFKLQKWDEADRQINKEELRNLGFCLVGFIIGRFPGIQAIEQVRNSWQVDSSISIHDSGWIIFSFTNEQDRDSVLERGPYETQGSAWILKKMPQYFSFDDNCFSMIPTWIRLHGLPLDFWSVNALGKIASFVGDPVAADQCTALLTKTSYARILVEVDVTKPLKREVSFTMPNGSTCNQKVMYEREPRWCSKCRMLGHLAVECRRKGGSNANPSPPQAKDCTTASANVPTLTTVESCPVQVPDQSSEQVPSKDKTQTSLIQVQQTSDADHGGTQAGVNSNPVSRLDNAVPLQLQETASPSCSKEQLDHQSISHTARGQLLISGDMEAGSMMSQAEALEEVPKSPLLQPSSTREPEPSSPSQPLSEEASQPFTNVRTRKQKSKGKGKTR